MHIDELRAPFGLSRKTINTYVCRGIIPPPRGRTRNASYTTAHVDALRAYQALKHNNTVLTELGAYLREENLTLVEYVRAREERIKDHGLVGHE